jgi:chromosome segregation ATPase
VVDNALANQQDLAQAMGTRDLHEASKQFAQLERELADMENEVNILKRSQEALHAQLQANHNELHCILIAQGKQPTKGTVDPSWPQKSNLI